MYADELASHYQQVRSRLTGKPVREVLNRAVLDQVAPDPPKPLPLPKMTITECIKTMVCLDQEPWRDGIERICRVHKTSFGAVTGASRSVYLVTARRECARYLYDRGWTMTKIGEYLGQRDHSSISNLLNPNHKRSRYEQQREALSAKLGMDAAANDQGSLHGPDGEPAAVAGA